jgi:hypothetical protein
MTVQELFDKALHDPAFWKELRKDPSKAFKEAGVKVTPEQLQSLKKLDYKALEGVAEAFGGGGRIIT